MVNRVLNIYACVLGKPEAVAEELLQRLDFFSSQNYFLVSKIFRG